LEIDRSQWSEFDDISQNGELMHKAEMKTNLRRHLTTTLVTVALFCALGLVTRGQTPMRGSLSGTVSADQGQVIGFRVAAHNLDQRLWYIVFTKKGHYTLPQALPGRYEVMVNEPGYSSPRMSVQLGPGETKTVDIAVNNTPGDTGPVFTSGASGGARNQGVGQKIVYVTNMEEVYPAGPGRDMIKQDCTGCHADNLAGYHFTKAQFVTAIEKMTETGPGPFPNVLALGRTNISISQKEIMADYLAKNFGPGMPERRLRVDPQAVDEEVASKAIYVSYDIPADLPLYPNQGTQVDALMIDGVVPQTKGATFHHLQQAAISPLDGSIWYSSRVSNSLLRLDPKNLDPVKRWKNYPIKGDSWVAVNGPAIDSKGRVYWSEHNGGRVGELDPATGKQLGYAIPQQGADVGIVVDKDDNVCFGLIWGAQFGRIDAKTRVLHTYPTPTPDNGIYGMAVDRSGNMWGAGWQKGMINKWDPETGLITEYPVPESWGQIRRIGVDSKGIVYGSAHNTGIVVRLDPGTGKITDFKVPVNGANPYDAWPDKQDNVWSSDQTHSTMIKLDPKTGKWTFYPMPQPHQSVPKIDVAADNTIWFGTRGLPTVVAVHFYPNGYSADAPPLP
jgi:streptogramin lyase